MELCSILTYSQILHLDEMAQQEKHYFPIIIDNVQFIQMSKDIKHAVFILYRHCSKTFVLFAISDREIS